MTKEYDVVVVGAGHNSLSAAAYLARAGLSVGVFEKNATVGGGAVTHEVTAPGFKHDTHAASIYLMLANPLIKDDELGLKEKFGLEFIFPEANYVSLFEDESWIGTYQSLDKTYESIARFSEKDANTYVKFAQRAMKMEPDLTTGMFLPPGDPEEAAAHLSSTEEGREILDLFPRSAYDYILETYEHPKVQMHFLRWVAEGNNPLNMPGTTPWLYLFAAVGHTYGGGLVVGGTQGISDALAESIKHDGGEIHVNSWVKRVETSDGVAVGVELENGEIVNAKKAVVGAIHPHRLGTFVDGLADELLSEAKDIPLSAFGGIHGHWALNDRPRYKSDIPDASGVLAATSSLEKLMSICSDAAAGILPRDFSALINTHTIFDTTRAPDGKHILAMYAHAPLILKNTGPLGGRTIDGWNDEVRDEYRDWMLAEYSKYCVNMSDDNIIQSAIQSPKDMAAWSPSFYKGDIMGVSGNTPAGRPSPSLANYSVPGATGLYLTGPFCHPGGSINGGGRGTALKVLEDLGVDVTGKFAV